MAIQLPNGFKIGSVEPIDTRVLLTKSEMLSADDNTMPPNYFCICNDSDDDKGKIFVYDKAATASATTGKFKPFEDVISTLTEAEIRDICV